ncbi:MAG TPA: hypothetical protein VJN95_16550 [Gemmatimonadales bacterium]|nr:hypothetical protein [Gemmatimonadales bacterium]
MDRSVIRARLSLRSRHASWCLLALVSAAGCSHSEPFQPGNEGPTGPHNSTLPYQLTLSTDQDLSPSRAADGNWLYAYTERTQGLINRCLAELPLDGGARTRSHCDVSLGIPGHYSTLTWPAESQDGRLVYFRTRGVGIGGPQTSAGLMLGSFATRDSGQLLRAVPYASAHGTVRGITHLHWLDGHTLIYVATQVEYRCVGLFCNGLDTLESGLQIERFDLDHPPAIPDVVPGTDYATSVDPDADGSGFFYTIVNDTRVYHRTVATARVDTVYDWGGLGIARDVQGSDSVLYAVVGGSVSPDTAATGIQVDHGGVLRRVDLRTGTTSLVDLGGILVRHPSLNAGKHRIVAESTDPAVDLWLAVAP